MSPPPFDVFARSIQPQSALRDAITAAWRRPETECLPPLLELASLSPAQTARARRWPRDWSRRCGPRRRRAASRG